MQYVEDHYLFPLVREPGSRWEKAGLSPRQERSFNRVATLLMALFVTGWVYSIFLADPDDLPAARGPVASVTSQITRSPFEADAAPATAFVLDEFVTQYEAQFASYRGTSGAVKVVTRLPGEEIGLPTLPDSVPPDARVELQPAAGTAGAPAQAGRAPNPGIWNVVLRMKDAVRPAGDLSVVTMVPLSEKRGGKIGSYLIGNWRWEKNNAPNPIYNAPRGLIRVTPENKEMYLSEHIQLKDFITKGQENVWPKYVAVNPRILDKVELVIQEMERMGHPVKNIFAVSGFRTPYYNAHGGSTSGRGALSRHMYGDAMDIAVDNDGNGVMDDLNGDGRVNLSDARIIGAAVDAVERKYPAFVGGMHYYPPTGGHQGMVHIDTRGFRARW